MIDRLTTSEHQLQATVMELSLTCNHLRYLGVSHLHLHCDQLEIGLKS